MTPRAPKGKPFVKGPDPRRSIRAGGRPTDDFVQQMKALTTSAEVFQALRSILSDKDHPHFMKALAFAADRAFGRPQLALDITTAGQPITVITGVPEADAYTPLHFLPSPDHTGAH